MTALLYEAQLADAMDIRHFDWSGGTGDWTDAEGWHQKTTPNVYRISQRDYLYGDIDDFEHDGAGSIDDADVDADWVAAIQDGSALPLNGFDDLTGNQNIAFTMNYALDPGEKVVHGSLALAMKLNGGTVNTDFVRLFDHEPEHRLTFTELGWDTQVNASDTFVGVLDLGIFLAEMQTGSVNVNINDDVGLDWALYTIAVATPLADAAGPTVSIEGGGAVRINTIVDPIAGLELGVTGMGELVIQPSGRLDVTGDFDQSNGGSLAFELSGATSGQYGEINVAGAAALGGALEVRAIGGFMPSEGDVFHLIDAATISGLFSTRQLPELSGSDSHEHPSFGHGA